MNNNNNNNNNNNVPATVHATGEYGAPLCGSPYNGGDGVYWQRLAAKEVSCKACRDWFSRRN